MFGMKNILTSKIAAQGFPKPECVRPFTMLLKCVNAIFQIVIQEHKESREFADFFGGIIVIHMVSLKQARSFILKVTKTAG